MWNSYPRVNSDPAVDGRTRFKRGSEWRPDRYSFSMTPIHTNPSIYLPPAPTPAPAIPGGDRPDSGSPAGSRYFTHPTSASVNSDGTAHTPLAPALAPLGGSDLSPSILRLSSGSRGSSSSIHPISASSSSDTFYSLESGSGSSIASSHSFHSAPASPVDSN